MRFLNTLLNLVTIIFCVLVIPAHAEVHPKISATSESLVPPSGFTFDMQSNDNQYFAKNIDYLKQQITAIKKSTNKSKSQLFQTIISRSREVAGLAKLSYKTDAYQQMV